jgi:hypothetical protein
MLYVQPAYALNEWLPNSDTGKPSWAALSERALIDKAARAKDNRTEIEL